MILALLLLAASAAPDGCRALERHGRPAEAQVCWQKLSGSPDAALRAEALWGLKRYQDAGKAFESALKAAPRGACRRSSWRWTESPGRRSRPIGSFRR